MTPDQPVRFDKCLRFKEIHQDAFQIPPRSSKGTCYYVRLMSRVSQHSSGTKGEKRVDDVLASDHNGNSNNYIQPFLLGERVLAFENLSNWNLAISGAFNDPNADMAIDNFFLIEAHFPEIGQDLMWGFGTADAEPGSGSKPILVNANALTNFTAFAPSGTAVVSAIDIRPQASQNLSQAQFRFRALDCGGSATSTDVFLVIH